MSQSSLENNALSSPQAVKSQFISLSLNSGYDYEFVDELDSKYSCSICLLALCSPTQTKCGHRFCHDCIIGWMNGRNKECPIDKLPLSENDLFHDSCVEREILHMKVKCPNASLGCNCHIELRYIEDHIHACVYQPVLCPNECSVTVLQKELEDHLVNYCLHRLKQCKSCSKTFTHHEEQLHLAECPLVSVSCHLCGIEIPRGHVAEHQNESCPSKEVSCKFIEHGCYFHASRNEMKQHNQQAIDYHMQLLSAAYKKINTLVLDLYRNVGQVASGNFTRQPSLRSQLSQTSIAEGQLSPSSDKTVENNVGGAVCEPGAALSSPGNWTLPDLKQNWNYEQEVRQSQQSMLDPTNKKGETKEATGDVKGDSKEVEASVKPCKSSPQILSPMEQSNLLRNLSDKFLDMSQRILVESIKVDKLVKKVDFLEYNLSVLTTTNFTGTLVWKIRGFSEICEEMKKKNKVLHSPPFYTSQFGYKFCLRTNLNVFKGETFLTLYIHTMQSNNDDYLSWPFMGKIVLSILDGQEGHPKNHCEENIDVKEHLDSFRRPSMPTNVKGYGFKEFIPLNEIVTPTSFCNYLKNDVLCIKAVVIPK